MFTDIDLSLIALIGIILLIGIVKKNAIMMIDFALDAERSDGPAPARSDLPGLPHAVPADHDDDDGRDALARLPLAIGLGTGSELRQPLGVSVVGGLVLSQALTLYTTPVIYLTFESLGQRVKAWRRQRRLQFAPA